MPTVIAFHGSFSSGARMREDIGDPPWVDIYTDGHNIYQHVEDITELKQDVVLVGYSLGGSLIGDLTWDIPTCIKGVVLYESPLLDVDCVSARGNYHVLMIWNDRGVKFGPRRREALESEKEWSRHRAATVWMGSGRHTKRVWRTSWPFTRIAHGWDTTLNNRIGNWIAKET